MSAKKKDPVQDAAPADNSAEDIMRKYDKESATRIWEGVPGAAVKIILEIGRASCRERV